MIILNESKIKYEKLDELLNTQLTDIRFSQQVNIIVDLKEVIKKFFRPDIMPEIQNKRLMIEEISSDIINIIGHYRNYFFKKGKYTSFYFLYSFSKCNELIQKMPNYKKEYYEKYFDLNDPKVDVVTRAIRAVEKVISVIPNCIFIDTSKHDELVYTKFIIENIPTNQLIILLSNDEVMYQVLSKNVFLLNLKGIKSDLLTNENAVSILSKRESTLSAGSIPLIIAISGNKKYCFQGIPRVATIKAIQIVEHLVSREIAADVNSIEIPVEFSKLDISNKLEKLVYDSRDSIIENYKLIRNDEELCTNKILLKSEVSENYKPKQTYAYFLELNAKIYNTYPLQLDMMLKGEKI